MRLSKELIYERVANGVLDIEEALSLLESGAEMEQEDLERLCQPFPLSEAQKAVWVAYNLSKNNYAYNVPVAFRIPDSLDVQALENAYTRLLQRHPGLRAKIVIEGDQPVQVVNREPNVSFQRVRLGRMEEEQTEQLLLAEVRKPFDLEKGPLTRAIVYEIESGARILVMNFHHLVFDGVSLAIFIKELVEACQAEVQGKPPVLPSLPVTYRDYVEWEQAMLSGEEGERHRSYWHRQLEGDLPALDLPFQMGGASGTSFEGTSCEIEIDAALVRNIKQLAVDTKVSVFPILLAAYQFLIHNYSGQNDSVVGIPMMGRPDAVYQNVIGYFSNVVPIRSRIDLSQSFRSFLEQVSETAFEAHEHSAYPLFVLLKELGKKGATLIQTSFHFQNWMKGLDALAPDADTVSLEPIQSIHQEGEFNLTMEVHELGETTKVYIKYNPHLFASRDIERMAGHYVQVLREIVKNPDRPLQEVSILTLAEQKQFEEWNDTTKSYPSDRCYFELFEEQAAKHPDRTAVLCDGQVMTYGELSVRSSQFAAFLQAHGVEPGSFVGILLDRTPDILVAMLGVQKAGAAYIPLDPVYPVDRLAYMLDTATAKLLVTQTALEGLAPTTSANIVCIDREFTVFVQEIEAVHGPKHVPNYKRTVATDSPMYLLFTSGSTGKPKGVLIPHRAVVNFLCSMQEKPGFRETDHLLATTTVCFDISVLELYLPLLCGGLLEIVPNEILRDGLKLKEKLISSGATVMQATPATWRMLLNAEWDTRLNLKILIGGEALSQELANQLLARCTELWNMFGPTETTVWSLVQQIHPGEKILIGRPIANTDLYILDSQFRQVPVGVPGELFIGGDGVAIGYLNRPDETAKRFIEHPFRPNTGERVYRTGDLAKFQPDGSVECLGRIDNQVKLRGYRIELGEIESALLRINGVQDSVVVVRTDASGHKQLAAFLILQEGAVMEERAALTEQLREFLPHYMIPSVYTRLHSYPQTLNRKVDRKSLSELPMKELLAQFGDTGASSETLHVSVLTPSEQNEQKAVSQTTHLIEGEDSNAFLEQKLMEDLQVMIANVLQMEAQELNLQEDMGQYGFDSIRFVSFSLQYKKKYGVELDPNKVLEFTTVATLSNYLLRDQYHLMREYYRADLEAMVPKQQAQPGAPTFSAPSADLSMSEPVAVIGMYGRLPQASNLDQFWNHLIQERSLVTPMPEVRLKLSDTGEEREWNREQQYAGAYLDNVDQFDPAFFGLSKQEAEWIDPQQRLLLETVWQTIEHAGYRPSDLSGTHTGVFVGLSGSDYHDLILKSGQGSEIPVAARQAASHRISSAFHLHGPSLTIDTADSSSLVALHQAVTALRVGACEMAIAGGVNLLLNVERMESLRKTGLLSETGMCKVFSAEADGTVLGEGVAALLLKPLGKAVEDGDHIFGVIKATGESHGGHPKSLDISSAKEQAELLVRLYRQAGFDPRTVSCVEVNGAGTLLGDSTETSGLKRAFQELYRQAGLSMSSAPHVAIGSVKPNVGHLEAASGIVGLLKVLLSFQNERLPKSLYAENRNPYLDLEGSPFRVAQQQEVWNRPLDEQGKEQPLRAGVSSFGIGGGNAHVLLEEYRTRADVAKGETVSPCLLVLSAKNAAGLEATATQLAGFLAEKVAFTKPLPDIADIAYTLQTGREEMEERLALVVNDVHDAIQKLQNRSHWYRNGSAVSLNPNDPAWQLVVSQALEMEDLHRLAQLWADGMSIDWQQLYPKRPSRVPLPASVFVGETCWFPARKDAAVSRSSLTLLGVGDRQPSDRFLNHWKQLKAGKNHSIGEVDDIVRDYLRYVRKDGKMTHLLVQTRSAGKLEVIVVGKGAPLLLIPGFSLTAPLWTHQIRAWSDKYQLVIIHSPGFGRSEVGSDLTFRGIADAYLEVLDELEIGQPLHVIGSSWGGLLGQTIAKTYPERVASLTLVSSPYEILDHPDEIGLRDKVELDFKQLGAEESYELFLTSEYANPRITLYNEVLEKGLFHTRDVYPHIQVPTLVLAGDRDTVIDLEVSKEIAAAIPGAEFEVIAGAGHGMNVTHAEAFNSRVLQFLQKHSPRKRKNAPRKSGE